MKQKTFKEYWAETPVDLQPSSVDKSTIKVIVSGIGGAQDKRVHNMKVSDTVQDLINILNTKEDFEISKLVGVKGTASLGSLAKDKIVEFKTQVGVNNKAELEYSAKGH